MFSSISLAMKTTSLREPAEDGKDEQVETMFYPSHNDGHAILISDLHTAMGFIQQL